MAPEGYRDKKKKNKLMEDGCVYDKQIKES